MTVVLNEGSTATVAGLTDRACWQGSRQTCRQDPRRSRGRTSSENWQSIGDLYRSLHRTVTRDRWAGGADGVDPNIAPYRVSWRTVRLHDVLDDIVAVSEPTTRGPLDEPHGE